MRALLKARRGPENYLDYVPLRNPALPWREAEGRVTVTVPHRGLFDRIAQGLFLAPAKTDVGLDRLGGFVWRQIDGETPVSEIAERVREAFGGDAEPLYPRLVKYLETLRDQRFIRWKP